MFKPGDKVICIDVFSVEERLELGRVYEVAEAGETGYVRLKVGMVRWSASRFIYSSGLAKVLYSVDARKGDKGDSDV